jgi:hypothetical protein
MPSYKKFGQTGANTQPNNKTFINNLSLQDNQSFSNMPVYQQPIRSINNMNIEPNLQFEMIDQRNPYGADQPFSYQQPTQQNYYQSPPSIQQQQYYQQPLDCKSINEHINQCNVCSRLYRREENKYILIIITLILFIIYLITKIMDK